MRYPTLLAVTLAMTTPALASTSSYAFSISDVEALQSDASSGCLKAYQATVPSCTTKLPGSCSDDCQQGLKDFAADVIIACRFTNDPQGQLKKVFSGTFVRDMCSGGPSINSDSTLVFAAGTQSSDSALASPTLAIDPSFAAADATSGVLETAPAPSGTTKYAPSTMQTSSPGKATSPPTSNNGQPADANGSPFGSTETQQQHSAGSRSHLTMEKSRVCLLLSIVVAALL